jgi:thioredoxin reductase
VRVTELLVIGAGPYGLAAAAFAQERGIDTTVVGEPMSFWRRNMPDGMLLRSGPDWHLDASGVHTFAAFVEERGLSSSELDPITLRAFVDYCDWFRQVKRIVVRDELVADLDTRDGGFSATLAGGKQIVADAVVCAPGIRHYPSSPEWAASVPEGLAAHTCNLVQFETLTGARVLIVGGRQSAYEWAALIHEQGVERIDLVHRHPVPRFDRPDWSFVDAHVNRTVSTHGYWRNLQFAERSRIERRFWEVGRLTVEHWLAARVDRPGIHLWPEAEVDAIDPLGGGTHLEVRLSNAERVTVDRIVFATGYRADVTRVPYLASLARRLEVVDGFPVLDEHFGTSLPGLYITGFSATRDFGPFFGFVKGAPAAASLIVRNLLSRQPSSSGRPPSQNSFA